MKRLGAAFLLLTATAAAAAEFRSIAQNGAVLYDAPSTRAKKLFVTSRDYPVEVMVSIENWAKVRDQSGELAWVEKKVLSDKHTVVVTVPKAEVRQEPKDDSPVLFQVQQGVVLEVAELAPGGWLKARHRDGPTGYIRVAQVWGM